MLASQSEPKQFWRRYNELNGVPNGSSSSATRAARPVLVFRGNDQGLSNNLFSMLSTLLFSVLIERRFKIDWNHAGELDVLHDVLSLDELGGPSVLFNRNLELGALQADPAGNCSLTLGCCMSHLVAAHARNYSECYRSLQCLNATRDPLYDECPTLSVTSNAYFVRYFQVNLAFQSQMSKMFGSTPDQIIAQRLASTALEPAAAVLATIEQNFPGWPYNDVLGVQFRALFHEDIDRSIECVRQTLAAFKLKRVFLAADRDVVREAFNASFPGMLMSQLNYTLSEAEDPVQRARSVRFGWQEAVMIGQLQHKVLTFPASTFAHLIYVRSPSNARVVSFAGCVEHPPWRDVHNYMPGATCGATDHLVASQLTNCLYTPPLGADAATNDIPVG